MYTRCGLPQGNTGQHKIIYIIQIHCTLGVGSPRATQDNTKVTPVCTWVSSLGRTKICGTTPVNGVIYIIQIHCTLGVGSPRATQDNTKVTPVCTWVSSRGRTKICGTTPARGIIYLIQIRCTLGEWNHLYNTLYRYIAQIHCTDTLYTRCGLPQSHAGQHKSDSCLYMGQLPWTHQDLWHYTCKWNHLHNTDTLYRYKRPNL